MKIKTTHIKCIILIVLVLLCSFNISFAQWVNDPSSNTKLIIDPVDPINVTALSDNSGGSYVFWQDKKGSSESDIYFIHFNKNGDVSFRADGKAVSTRSGKKENPITFVEPTSNAIVIWKGYDKKKNPELFIQKLTKNGLRLWNSEGIQLTDDRSEKIDYSMQTDKKSYTFISYVAKNLSASNKYSVRYQRLNVAGKSLSDSLKGVLYHSNNTLSAAKVITDNKGGAFVFWLENLNQKTVLRGQFVDSTGSKKWESNPITISKANNNVLGYSVDRLGNGIYTTITYQGDKKIIYQNLISEKGKLLWGNDGKLLTYQTGSQANPQFAFIDSSVVVSWTNDFEKVKDVFIQRFDVKGNKMWGNNGKRVINIKGNQFGQKIVYDKKDGIIISWVDKRENSSDANLYIQKIDLDGQFVWDSLGVMISSSKDMEKSYLNLIPDLEGGAVVVFKGSSNKRNNIYGQRIFSTGTYASQILGFTAQVVDDSVKVFWYAANETEGTTYSIYRTHTEDAKESDWKIAGTVNRNKKTDTNYYEFYDLPDINGSIFYRIVQKNDKTKTQFSAVEKVDYFSNAESIMLGQNSPNPFKDATTISFYLPQKDEVTFEFFNSNIETIKKIDDVEYPAGKNEIVFNAENLSPGIYFYRLKVKKFVDVKKMIITE